MATFTRNAWVTGETITADGLNGGKGGNCILTLTEEEATSPLVEFSVDIGTGFSPTDFTDLVLVTPDSDGGVVSYKSKYVYVDSYGYTIGFGENPFINPVSQIYYYPESGILTTSDTAPES